MGALSNVEVDPLLEEEEYMKQLSYRLKNNSIKDPSRGLASIWWRPELARIQDHWCAWLIPLLLPTGGCIRMSLAQVLNIVSVGSSIYPNLGL